MDWAFDLWLATTIGWGPWTAEAAGEAEAMTALPKTSDDAATRAAVARPRRINIFPTFRPGACGRLILTGGIIGITKG
ncbi:hypothetical protein NCCP1664_20680 [Zafaria cholistanensis]|uniref:Uncharacterized protein n=1 Tax=Zafaria cholistanensis TaxID=1682741 RepID=A0A5A7NRU1_9MICC|nr:hypothetical protein NCCP1664_20680 [Zafaria cholistanensis]